MLRQFDIVQIITTKQIKYLSGPQGHASGPNGNWSIVGFVGNDAILAKESTLVRVPLTDIRQVGGYNIDKLLDRLSTTGYLNNDDINVSSYISKELNIDIAKARRMLLDYNLKLTVKSEQERDQIAQKVKELCQKTKKKNPNTPQ